MKKEKYCADLAGATLWMRYLLYPVLCDNRGMFFFGPATISSGDMLWLFKDEKVFNESAGIVVFPISVYGQ
jgi:uncharacterized protein (DUF58 family)